MKKSIVMALMLAMLVFLHGRNCLQISAEGQTNTKSASTDESMAAQDKEWASLIAYNTLLKEWAYSPDCISDTDANFPVFYGGAYLNAEKRLILQVTRLDDKVQDYFSNLIDTSDVIFEKVKYSYCELMAQKEDILLMSRGYHGRAILNVAGVGISFQDNSVRLYIVVSEGATNNDILQEVKELTKFENVVTERTAGLDQPCAAVEPGTEIDTASTARSVGF